MQRTAFDVKFAGINAFEMAETLGSLCDKLTIVKLKQFHSEDAVRLESLAAQEIQLQEEINSFVAAAVSGNIPVEKLTFSSNKVYKKEGNETREIGGDIGVVFAELAKVNCDLWHEQEKVYEFEKVAAEEKDNVVKRLAVLNLERNKCIDAIDNKFRSLIAANTNT
ncbi:MAG TPA: hypothetical protein VFV31_15805 [Chitinophagaceae bacterium]|nr:hypothetical protein [Chitinophagaceae bacterium]